MRQILEAPALDPGPAQPRPAPGGQATSPEAEPAGRSRRASTSGLFEHGAEDLPGLVLDAGQVAGSLERLGVELVDVLGARRPGREPAGGGDDLEPAERLAVARGGRLPGEHRLAGEFVHTDLLR